LLWAYKGWVGRQHCDRWLYVAHISAWLVLKGKMGIHKASGTVMAQEGEWIIGLPGKRLQVASEGCQILSICFIWEWIYGRELYPQDVALALSREEGNVMRRLGTRLVSRAQRSFPNAGSNLAARSASFDAHLTLQVDFDAWLVAFSAAMTKRGIMPHLADTDRRVETAVQILDQPGPATPRPPELARRLGISTVHLNRLFIRELGMTIRAYLEKRRLIRARALLITSELSVKETAFRLGFASPQHFARWFHFKSGFTPTQWRERDSSML
jgi:AraC-like DNA-binding protein